LDLPEWGGRCFGELCSQHKDSVIMDYMDLDLLLVQKKRTKWFGDHIRHTSFNSNVDYPCIKYYRSIVNFYLDELHQLKETGATVFTPKIPVVEVLQIMYNQHEDLYDDMLTRDINEVIEYQKEACCGMPEKFFYKSYFANAIIEGLINLQNNSYILK
jgi:hypothetical protein